jgi:hypothetical protein
VVGVKDTLKLLKMTKETTQPIKDIIDNHARNCASTILQNAWKRHQFRANVFQAVKKVKMLHELLYYPNLGVKYFEVKENFDACASRA